MLAIITCGALVGACSSPSVGDSFASGAGAANGQGGANSGSCTDTSSNGGMAGGSASSSSGGGTGGACASTAIEIKPNPFGMYLMTNRSGSMQGTRWTDVTNAIKSFIDQPSATGIGVGFNLTSLNGIAAAGGTGQAFLIDANTNAQQEFLQAMNAIRLSAQSRTYAIPPPPSGQMLNYATIRVQYTPSTAVPELLERTSSLATCPPNGKAWYYDNDAAPQQILLCPNACSIVSADSTGRIEILIDCTMSSFLAERRLRLDDRRDTPPPPCAEQAMVPKSRTFPQ